MRIMNMDFGSNKTPAEVIKEGAFGGTYFRDIYSGVNSKWFRKLWKEFDDLENIDQKYCFSNYYDVNVNKCGVKFGTSLRLWENIRWINSVDSYGWFQWFFRYWLGGRSLDDKRQIATWKRIVSRFKGKLVKMMKDVNDIFDASRAASGPPLSEPFCTNFFINDCINKCNHRSRSKCVITCNLKCTFLCIFIAITKCIPRCTIKCTLSSHFCAFLSAPYSETLGVLSGATKNALSKSHF